MTNVALAISRKNTHAILLMVGAAGLIAATSIIAKLIGLGHGASPGLHPFQVSAGRFVFGFATPALVLLVIPNARPNLVGVRWGRHLVRLLCGWMAATTLFGAVAQMPVAEATAISFLSPLVTMGLAVLMLGERLGLKKLIAAGLALAGAALILKPGSGAFQSAGLLALAAAGFMGLEAIFIKRLSDTEPAFRVLLINNAIGAIVSVTVASLFWTPPSSLQWLQLAGLGAVMVAGQAVFIQAMKRADASFAIPAFYSALVYAALYDFALFGVIPDWAAMLGGGLILAGAIVLVRRR